MSLALVQCSWFFAPSDHAVSLRAIGLVVLAIGAYFAFFTPRWLKDSGAPAWRSSRSRCTRSSLPRQPGRSSCSLACIPPRGTHMRASTRWPVREGSCSLPLCCWWGRCYRSPVPEPSDSRACNMGPALAFPFLAAAAMDAFMLGYFWLAPTRPASAAACSAGPVGTGETVVAAFSVAVALIAFAGAIGPLLAARSARSIVSTALLPAAAGAGLEVALVVVRGPQHWATSSHLAGVDLMLACAAIGVWVFIGGCGQHAIISHLNRSASITTGSHGEQSPHAQVQRPPWIHRGPAHGWRANATLGSVPRFVWRRATPARHPTWRQRRKRRPSWHVAA